MELDYGVTPEDVRAAKAQYGGMLPSWWEPWGQVGSKDRKKKRTSVAIRGAITKSKRATVYARDGFKCVECGEDDYSLLTIDHKVPKSKGGHNGKSNLQTMCGDCNRRKADALP